MFVGKRNTTYIEYTENTRFPCIFWERSSFTYPLEKMSYFREKEMPSFLMIQERSYSSAIFFGKTTFLEHLKKISYFQAFFWERSSFNKIIFSGKKYHLFWWYKKYLFRTFEKRKYGFSCGVPRLSSDVIVCITFALAELACLNSQWNCKTKI